MDAIEKEIREAYAAMNTLLATKGFLTGGKWDALSQYGYCIAEGFDTQAEAEAFAVNRYRNKMNLIRQ